MKTSSQSAVPEPHGVVLFLAAYKARTYLLDIDSSDDDNCLTASSRFAHRISQAITSIGKPFQKFSRHESYSTFDCCNIASTCP